MKMDRSQDMSLGAQVVALTRVVNALMLRMANVETAVGRVNLIAEANRIDVLARVNSEGTRSSPVSNQRISDDESKAITEALIVMACADTKISRTCLFMARAFDVSRIRDWVWFEASRKGVASMQLERIFGKNHSSILAGIKRERARRVEKDGTSRPVEFVSRRVA